MKFDDHINSHERNWSDVSLRSDEIDQDHWRRLNDDWDFYRRQQETWFLEQSSPVGQEKLDFSSVDFDWNVSTYQPVESPFLRMLTGGATLALLGYLYWML